VSDPQTPVALRPDGTDAPTENGETASEAGVTTDDSTPPPVDVDTARQAVRQIRRETLKAAAVYAVLEAALVVAALAVGLTLLQGSPVPKTVTLPAGGTEGATLSGPVLVAAVVGVVVLVADFYRFARQPAAEWFERANPEVAEALRTARDAAADADDDTMARALYGDVLARLRETSSVRLLDPVQLAATVVLVVLLSLAATQLPALDVSVDVESLAPDGNRGVSGGAGEDTSPGEGAVSDGQGGLERSEDIFGDPENVEAGSVDLPATVDTGGVGDDRADRPFETGGFPSGRTDVDAQQTGFAPPEDVEDADLVREYNLRIRANETDTDTPGVRAGE
jgi:hypothetical protein